MLNSDLFLVKKITPSDAIAQFGSRILGPAEVHKMLKMPEVFKEIFPNAEKGHRHEHEQVFAGIAILTQRPLASYLKGKNSVEILSVGPHVSNTIVLPMDISYMDFMNKENALILLKGGFTFEVKTAKESFKLVIDSKCINQNKHIEIFEKDPNSTGWFEQKSGMPTNREASSGNVKPDDLYFSVKTIYTAVNGIQTKDRLHIGAIMRMPNQTIEFGSSFIEPACVLVNILPVERGSFGKVSNIYSEPELIQ
jgi:hypothetical protein